MPKYAQTTEVAPEKTRTDIERVLTRYGATGFIYGWEGDQHMLAFQIEGRRIQFALTMPDRNSDEFRYKKINQHSYVETRTKAQQQIAWEQACRQRWRAFLLIITAKLEAVDAGITTIESEFLAHIALPGGQTVGQWLQPQLEDTYRSGRMPPLLPG